MASELPKEWWDDTIPPPARDRDWKPVTGEKVLVEAVVQQPFVDTVALSKGWVHVKIGEYPYGVPLSSIHPIPQKEGE